MMLQWYYVLVVLMTVSNATVDVDRTIQQVQEILQSNPKLPQLTREEIIQLMDELNSYDKNIKPISAEYSTEIEDFMFTTPYNANDNEISSTILTNIEDNIVSDDKGFGVSLPLPTKPPVEATTKCEKSVMVVMPFTPRDGASLQELYTRPPKVEVYPESKVTPRSITEKAKEKLIDTLKNNAQLANKQKIDVSNELEIFLKSHGMKGKPGQDYFLLPLEERYKVLPQVKITDKSGHLPEHIVFLYDLISPNPHIEPAENNNIQILPPNNFLYEPLQPELPSIMKKLVLPLHTSIVRHRKSKSTNNSSRISKQNKESISSNLVKSGASNLAEEQKVNENDFRKMRTYVKPQRRAPLVSIDQINDTPIITEHNDSYPKENQKKDMKNEFGKRQIRVTQRQATSAPMAEIIATTKTPTTTSSDSKKSFTNAHSIKDSDTAGSNSGASIADLEESFGGAAPEKPDSDRLPPPRKTGFYWMVDWNSFLKVDSDKEQKKLNIRFEPKLGDPQRFLP